MILVIKGKLFLLVTALGLAVLALAACGSNTATPVAAGTGGDQQAASADLAGLLRSQFGSAAFEQLLQGSLGTSTNTNSGIWVTGQGVATAEPDLGILNLGVEAFASTVAEARSDAASAMGQVIDVLKANGIADRDIQTRFFNINARYTTHEVTRCTSREGPDTAETEGPSRSSSAPIPPTVRVEESESSSSGVVVLEVPVAKQEPGEECFVERERVIVGFEVTNQLSVKVRELASIGQTIDNVTEAGGDLIRFQGVSFTIEDTKDLQDQARVAAVEDLMAKAGRIADLAGVALGNLVFITDTSGPVVSRFVSQERVAFAALAAPTPIQVGELNVTVSLQAAFNIGQPEG